MPASMLHVPQSQATSIPPMSENVRKYLVLIAILSYPLDLPSFPSRLLRVFAPSRFLLFIGHLSARPRPAKTPSFAFPTPDVYFARVFRGVF
jgi:hypothetical protein